MLTDEEKRGLEKHLNTLAIASEGLPNVQENLVYIIEEFDLDAEMVFCGPPTPEYLAAIGRKT